LGCRPRRVRFAGPALRASARPTSGRFAARNPPHVKKRLVVFRTEAPAGGPVLGPHLLAPAEGAGPVVEVPEAQGATVDEPYDDGSLRPRTDHGMRGEAVSAAHAPHDGRLIVNQRAGGVGHASCQARWIPGSWGLVSLQNRGITLKRSPPGRQKGRAHRDIASVTRGSLAVTTRGPLRCRP